MNAQDIQAYIQIAGILAAAGVDIAGRFKALIGIFRPGNTLTDEQINAIEQAGLLDSKRRQMERVAMGAAS